MGSPTILDRFDVLDGLVAVWNAIDELVADLTEAQWQAATPCPGWSVRDVVAHVIGTESMLEGAATPDAEVDVSTFDHVRNDVGVLNERWITKLRSLGSADLLATFRDTMARRREALSDMSDDAWNEVTATPVGLDTYGRFMRVRVFDCWMHEHDIRDALERPATDAELVSPAARLALDEMATSMGFVVGKLGGAPDGSRVRIELTGPLRRTINVEVHGRGRVVDDFAGQQPTSTITMDGLLFTRVAGGRTTPSPDAVGYGGDEAVGRRVVAHLNYVM